MPRWAEAGEKVLPMEEAAAMRAKEENTDRGYKHMKHHYRCIIHTLMLISRRQMMRSTEKAVLKLMEEGSCKSI